MIQLEHISQTYLTPEGKRFDALKDVSIHIRPGEIFGIIGRSGAGKSTLVRCINLLNRPTSGRVVVDGADLTAMSEEELRRTRRGIGMIFQPLACSLAHCQGIASLGSPGVRQGRDPREGRAASEARGAR